MYTLYYSPGACSMAVHIALLEMQQEVALQKLDMQAGQNRTPDFLKLNPRGQIPLLLDGQNPMREGAAMLISLAEKHNSPLLPKSGDERMSALEWLMFCNATLHPAYSRAFFLMRNAPEASPVKDSLMAAAIANINKLWEEVETTLNNSPYIAGANITLGDILLTVIANWSVRMPLPVTLGTATKAHLQKITARSAYQKALQVEQVEYKAAS